MSPSVDTVTDHCRRPMTYFTSVEPVFAKRNGAFYDFTRVDPGKGASVVLRILFTVYFSGACVQVHVGEWREGMREGSRGHVADDARETLAQRA